MLWRLLPLLLLLLLAPTTAAAAETIKAQDVGQSPLLAPNGARERVQVDAWDDGGVLGRGGQTVLGPGKGQDGGIEDEGEEGEEDFSLLPLKLTPLPLSSIHATPSSWLAHELRTSLHGLAGNLHTFYTVVKDSPWLVGLDDDADGDSSEYSGLNEGLPYWFNGAVALAYSFDTRSSKTPTPPAPPNASPGAACEGEATNTDKQLAELKTAIHTTATHILSSQQPTGWLGPEPPHDTTRNIWGRVPLLLGLTNLADANATWLPPVAGALSRFTVCLHGMLSDGWRGYVWDERRDGGGGGRLGEGDFAWGRVRYADLIVSLVWLFERFEEPHHSSNGISVSGKERRETRKMIWECMEFLRNGSLSWNQWYVDGVYPKGNLWELKGEEYDVGGRYWQWIHGVNVGQGLKAPAIDRRLTRNDSLIQTALNGVDWTFKYHGAPPGTILADERLDGLNPWSGSELCTTVETLYSLTHLHRALGHAHFADLAELNAYNALPAALTGDHWAHQYMTQPNQPWSAELCKQDDDVHGTEASPFSTANAWAQTYGLEPQYPCCTVNHAQGWPKFLMATYAKRRGDYGEEGLVHALLGPATVETTLRSADGRWFGVSVVCETDYPFGDTLRYNIHAGFDFEFSVRIPAWYVPSTSSIALSVSSDDIVTNDAKKTTTPLGPSHQVSLHTMHLPAGTSTVTYILGASIRTIPRANDTVAIYRGALLYALAVGSTETSTAPKRFFDKNAVYEGASPEVRDWELRNTTAWNYAIDVTSLTWVPGNDTLRFEEGGSVFSPERTRELGSIYVRACRVEWPLWIGSVPSDPLPANARRCLGFVEEVRLVPYGSAKLHMAELPVVDLSDL